MRRAAAISLVVLAFYSARTLPQQGASTATIEGTVVRSDSSEPVAGAQVTLTSAPLAGAVAGGAFGGIVQTALTVPPPAGGAATPVTTGPDGKFVFKDLGAGSYRIVATATGFVRTEYGQRALNGQGRPVFITAGQTLKDAVLRMTPTGTATGRVFDENGQPAIGAPLQLLRAVYSAQGKNYQVGGTGAADDRGDYRIYGVSPGRYYLLAGNPPGPVSPSGGLLVAGGAPSGARYSAVFYPAAAKPEEGTTIEVQGGREATFDMRVQRQTQTFRVSGRIVDATGNGLPANTSVNISYRTLTGGGGFSTGRSFDPATGTFELQNIPAGDYTLQAQIPDPNPIRPPQGPINAAASADLQAAQAARPSGQAPVHVDKDLQNIIITVSNSVTANGRFVVEGQQITAVQNIQQLSLAFTPYSWLAPPMGMNPVGLSAQPDGTFQVVGLREGEYRVTVRGSLNTGNGLLYVKSIQYSGEDILSKPFRFSGAGSGEFQVVLHSGPGQIAGNVTDNKSQPVPGIQVVAIPAERSRTLEYRPTITDQNGHFSFTALSPGDYQLFSWESIDNGAYYDPDFLKANEQQGKFVHVAESSSQNVDLRLIPAP